MIDLIGKYDAIKNKLVDLAGKSAGTKLDAKMLKAPMEQPLEDLGGGGEL